MSVELRPEQLERLLGLEEKFAKEGLTFDDVHCARSPSVLPRDVSTPLPSRNIELDILVVSAAMDTVTEARTGDCACTRGRHRRPASQPADRRAGHRGRQGEALEAGMIVDPVTLPPDAPVAAALELMERYRISGVPVVEESGRLAGILTNRDLRFEDDHSQPVSELMTSRDLVTAPSRHDAGGGRGAAPSAQGREAPDRRPRRRAGRG